MHFVVDQLLATAQAHLQSGRLREAAAACEQALQTQPRNPRALFMMGFLLHQNGQGQLALQRLTAAVTENPNTFEPYFLIGLIHQQHRSFGAAIAAYQRALSLNPTHAKSLNNLGRALIDIGNTQDGINTLRRAVEVDPANCSSWNNLGDGLRLVGDYPAAVTAHQRAIAIDPSLAESHSNLGAALVKHGKIADGIQSMQRAIKLNPKLATPHYNLARVFQDQAKFTQAIQHVQIAVQLRPDYPDAINLLGNLAGITGDVPKAIAAQRRAVELNPGNAGLHSNLLLSFHYVDQLPPEQMFQAHRQWAQQHGQSTTSPTIKPVSSPRDDRRLRLGYVSSDFQHHSVAFFIEPVLAAHDRSEVEIFCYSNVSKPDAVTARLRTYTEHWRDIYGQPDALVADTIRNDQIDILVDLAGHTAENRLKLFALKPAPIQVTWLGYPDTTGLDTMDFRITDAIADPPGIADQLHTEKLIRVEGGCWAYQPPADAPDPAPAPPAIANGFITFGSFNNLPKVTADVAHTWANILNAVPASRLMIKALGLSCDLGRETVIRHLTAAGVDPSRVQLLGWAPSTLSHLELYNRIDIALDAFPYNGTTTTCEALWMGVPVISFPGQTHAGRVGASLLTHGGFPEFLARNREDYVQRCAAFSQDIPKLSELRHTIRSRFAASPIFDASRLCRQLVQLGVTAK